MSIATQLTGYGLRGLLLLLLLLASCTSQRQAIQSIDRPANRVARVAAQDLVFALSQHFPPRLTTLQVGPTTTPFSHALVAEITEAGYGVQMVSADQGKNHLRHARSKSSNADNTDNYRFLVHIGKTGFERNYALTPAGDVAPASPMQFYGVNKPPVAHPELFVLAGIGESIRTVQPPSASTRAIRRGSSVRAVKKTTQASVKQLELIATDLVSTLIQIPGFSPYTTTLQVSTPPSTFGETLVSALGTAGYALQRVSSDQGVRYVSYGSRITENEAVHFTDYFLNAGKVTLNRAYERRARSLLPASNMKITGSEPERAIILSDRLFLQQGSELAFPNAVELVSSDHNSIFSTSATLPGASTNEHSAALKQPGAFAWAKELLAGGSSDNSAEYNLSRHTPIYQTSIHFVDDSLAMGSVKKELVATLHQQMQADSDILLLSACTPTGNSSDESLRQRIRVKEELLFLGAPIDRVLHEYCPEDSTARIGTGHIVNTAFLPGQVIITQFRNSAELKR